MNQHGLSRLDAYGLVQLREIVLEVAKQGDPNANDPYNCDWNLSDKETVGRFCDAIVQAVIQKAAPQAVNLVVRDAIAEEVMN